MTTRAKHWLCGVGLFVYGSVIHLLLFRLFVRWAYPPPGSASTGAGDRSFVDHPLTNGAITLLGGDRKSTRLNSSHGYISYAVFCLKKKKKDTRQRQTAPQQKRTDLPAPT